jgi:hypothetical protein
MKKGNLTLSYADIKGKNDLHAYHKYLTKYVGLDLAPVASSYQRLQQLREVRNQLIHRGGHVSDDEKVIKRISDINGVRLFGSLLVIENAFVWDVLDCAKKYLCTAAK